MTLTTLINQLTRVLAPLFTMALNDLRSQHEQFLTDFTSIWGTKV